MHAVTGRPNLLYTPSANRVPYAPVGTARPPRQGGHGAAGGGGAKGPSHRAKARDRWSALFAGPAYLEPGPSNRLVLSLRSCVPSEVDFALERLIQVSSIDPDLLRFNEFPGLLDGLVSLVRDYLDRRKEDRQAGVHHLVAAGLHAEARDISRRRACEASLILRNLALEKKSFDPILESRRLRRLIVDVLDEGELDGPEGEETTELRLYLLELVELIGEHVALAIPGHSIPLGADASDDAPQPKPEPLDAPSVRLFPLLVNLAASQDRALVLSAFRCLTALSLNEKSDQVFALLTYTHLAPQPKPSPHPVETAIRLLPLGDAELTSVVLDFLYQHTLLPSNAALFCTRPELVAILKLVCQKFELGAKIEQVETEILSTPSDAANWYKAKFGVIVANENGARTKRRKLHSTAASPAGEPVLPEAEVNEIVALQEPERAIGWMHRMYEIDPDSDITQVSLWTAYKTQFEPITQNPAVPAMLAAQEVIRLSGQAFPSATPTIVDDAEGRKFIIKGLKHRKRETVEGECGWAGCPVPAGHDDPLQFHQHVYNTHLNVSPPPAACCWTNCRFEIPVPPPPADPSLQIGQITLHVRTHLPLLSGSTSSSDVAAGDDDDDVSLPKAIAYHVRYHGQKDDHHHEATGPGFLACLILRNVVRAAKFAHESTVPTTALANGGGASATQVGGGGRVSVASGNAAIGRLAEGEQSIFEAFALAEESVGGVRGGPGGASSGRKGSVLQQVEKPDWSIAVPAIAALQSVHDRVLRMALSNVVLGKYLVESVVTIEGFGAATDTGNAVSTTQGDQMEE